MSTSTKQADRELNKFLNAQRDADIAAAANSFRTILAETVLKTFDFPIEPTAADFRRLFQLRHQRYVNVSSMLLSIAKEDGTFVNVPVTPKNQTEPKNQSFHSISIICGDGAILEFLIREHDNYVIGFRVYLSIQAKDVTPWRTFGEDVPSRLGKSDPTNYNSSHVKLGKVQFGKGILGRIFNFFKDLQLHPNREITDDGQRFVCTVFILFGEAQRFTKARQWVIDATDRDIAQTPNAPLIKLFNDWKGLSKTGMKLYVALWEERNLLFKYKDRYEKQAGYINPYEHVVKLANEACASKEREHRRANLCFRQRPTAEIDLSLLLGGEILLVKHDEEFGCKALIREGGQFDAPWPEEATWE
ncbi:uncharacterized protein LOC119366614 isoform X1 [Triticum dicoccoides]|uniref:uncharacterized protein LOC119366614 isoform X1 n=1 Tax=Triticum dicoccoides TaxID=85692 RepID=UPI000E79A021|nr:uncharacterized protein LOC119366614 isoform X1 [Triticum dicoccoides]